MSVRAGGVFVRVVVTLVTVALATLFWLLVATLVAVALATLFLVATLVAVIPTNIRRSLHHQA